MQYFETVTLKDGRTCVIRNCTERDAEAAAEVFNLTHAETDFLGSYPDENTMTVEREAVFLQKLSASPNEVELLAQIDGKAVGLAGINCIAAREKQRHRAGFGISILKEYWGLGVGRALTQACIACARQAGYAQLELDAVADNEHALALYKSVGFVEYGRNPLGFRSRISGWQPLVEMRLVLDERVTKQKDAVLFIHGLGGSAEEAEHYRPLLPDCDVIGFEYQSIEPWIEGPKIRETVEALCEQYRSVRLIGYSLGAFLAMHADVDALLKQAYFISPVVDMEQLILMLMAQDGVTEEKLKEQGTVPGSFGLVHSWEYLRYVREHPVEWRVPTAILYAEHDNLVPYETVRAFAQAHGADLSVMKNGEHWFHTDEQVRFLDDWLKNAGKE